MRFFLILLFGFFLVSRLSIAFAANLTHGPVVGGVSSDSATSVAKIFLRTDSRALVAIQYGTAPDLGISQTTANFRTRRTSDYSTIIELTGLGLSTTYHLNILVDGVSQLSPPYPSFKTFPAVGEPKPFKFVVLSDFSNMKKATKAPQTFLNASLEDPAFAFIGGDFDQRNPKAIAAKRAMFKNLYDPNSIATSDFVNLILKSMPIAHHWDDRDGGGKDIDKSYPFWHRSHRVFSEYVPTYPLPITTHGIWQSFSHAQVDFFVLDTRSQRDPSSDPDDINKSMLDGDNLGSAGQLEWLKNSLLHSAATWKIIFSSVAVNPTAKAKKSWGTYQTEWNGLRQFIEDNRIGGVVFASGDLGVGGIDSGVASGFPEMVVPTANSEKGRCLTGRFLGKWSEGIYNSTPCNGYGVVTVLTDPDRILLEVKDESGIVQLSHTVMLESQAAFSEVSDIAGVGVMRPSFGNPMWGNFDNDKNLDAFVVNHGNPPSFFGNNGDGSFTDLQLLSGITSEGDRHGAGWGDYDNDGDQDLFISLGAGRGSTVGSKTDQLYRNEGNGVFTDITTLAGVDNAFGRGRSVNWIDYNNDGELDLFVKNAGGGANKLYENNGDSTFTDVASNAGISEALRSNSSWADFDNDGDMDLFITGVAKSKNLFWQNNGDGTFTDITSVAGLDQKGGVGVAWGDYDDDGNIDLYVARGYSDVKNSLSWDSERLSFSDQEPPSKVDGLDFTTTGDQVTFDIYTARCHETEKIFIGSQNNSPLAIPFTLTATDAFGEPSYLPGTDLGFFIWNDPTGWHIRWSNNGSGTQNFYGRINSNGQFLAAQRLNVTAAAPTTENSLYRNNGNGTFTDVAIAAGVNSQSNDRGATWGDYDNDGDFDLYVVNTGTFESNGANHLYRNNGNGTFTDVAATEGVMGNVGGRGDGAAWGDFNNDGFLDLYVTNGHSRPIWSQESYPCLDFGPHLLFENSDNNNRWLKVDLTGTLSNSDAIGAKVILNSNNSTQYRQVNGGTGQLFSQGNGPLHFGLGDAESVDALTIQWPSGNEQIITNIAPNQYLTIVEE